MISTKAGWSIISIIYNYIIYTMIYFKWHIIWSKKQKSNSCRIGHYFASLVEFWLRHCPALKSQKVLARQRVDVVTEVAWFFVAGGVWVLQKPWLLNIVIEGSLEVKLLTIWTDEKQSRAEADRRERLEERRVEEKESEERRCRCAKR